MLQRHGLSEFDRLELAVRYVELAEQHDAVARTANSQRVRDLSEEYARRHRLRAELLLAGSKEGGS